MTKVAIWIFHQIFEGFPNSTKKKNIWFLMVFPIVQICENTEKNYAIQKFFIKFLKVFTIVLHFFVFLMVFPIVLVHQIHQKKVRFWNFRRNLVRIWTWESTKNRKNIFEVFLNSNVPWNFSKIQKKLLQFTTSNFIFMIFHEKINPPIRIFKFFLRA